MALTLESFDTSDFYCKVRSDLVNGVMTVSGDQWPVLVYENQEYDPEHPWEGLFRSKLLVWVSIQLVITIYLFTDMRCRLSSSYLHCQVP